MRGIFEGGAGAATLVVWALIGALVGGLIQRLYPWLRRMEEVDDEPATPWLDWAVPLITAAIFVLLRLKDDSALPLLTQASAVALLVQVFAFDLQHRLILDRVVFPGSLLLIGLAGLRTSGDCVGGHCWVDSLLAAALAGLFYLGLLGLGQLIFRRDALGWGDVKLAVLIGAIMGIGGTLAVVWALILGMLLGGVIGLLLVALRIRQMGDYIPYGPFMVAGAILAIFLYLPPHRLLGGP